MLFPSDVLNDRYRLERLIARGGMGEVWLATDTELDRPVALKTVNPSHLATNPKAISVLRDEAKTGASLIGHPNVVCVLDYAKFEKELDIIHYIVMEYVKGISLAEWIENTSQALKKKTQYYLNLFIAWELCKAIGVAHRNDILHRDIKPLNVFLSNYGITKVGDFGLARFVEAITRTHTVWQAMSPAYAAPEQWKGRKHDVTTDIYQLACTLYHLFAGRLPFDNAGLPAMMNAHLNETPTDPKDFASNVSDDLSKMILKGLEKKQNDRVSLWEINDVIAEEIRGTYNLSLDVHQKDENTIVKVIEIWSEPH